MDVDEKTREVADAKIQQILGRDELNFAEFPISALSRQAPKSERLTFADTYFDSIKKQSVQRIVTVTRGTTFGLPTSADDEVLLGLIQLASTENFQNQKTYFSRYELLRLLGWKVNGQNDLRVQQSIKRWKEVNLHFENAWWDNGNKVWDSVGFSLISNYRLLKIQTLEELRKRYPANSSELLSHITWDEVIFRSFQLGNLKKLDFEYYKNLDTPTSKRMYRFIEKRFYVKPRFNIELRSFACDHLGLSSTYDNSNLKRALKPAIQELEKKDFLLPLAETERFISKGKGTWEVCLIQPSVNSTKDPHPVTSLPKSNLVQLPLIKKQPAPKLDEEELTKAGERFGISLEKLGLKTGNQS